MKRHAGAAVVTTERPVVTEVVTEEPVETVQLDVDSLFKRLEARAKAMIALEEQERPTRTKVKFVLPCKVGLGEAWKIVGKCPELGMFVPEVAPYMQWNNGDIWTLEVPIRMGKITYKAVLKKPDGAYVWEEGKDRVIELKVPATGTMEVKLDKIQFPPA